MRMGLIYSKAVEVIAWLGVEAHDSSIAMEALAGHGYSSKLDPKDREPVREFFRRPYWKRVWIIQEISKARELHVLAEVRGYPGRN